MRESPVPTKPWPKGGPIDLRQIGHRTLVERPTQQPLRDGDETRCVGVRKVAFGNASCRATKSERPCCPTFFASRQAVRRRTNFFRCDFLLAELLSSRCLIICAATNGRSPRRWRRRPHPAFGHLLPVGEGHYFAFTSYTKILSCSRTQSLPSNTTGCIQPGRSDWPGVLNVPTSCSSCGSAFTSDTVPSSECR